MFFYYTGHGESVSGALEAVKEAATSKSVADAVVGPLMAAGKELVMLLDSCFSGLFLAKIFPYTSSRNRQIRSWHYVEPIFGMLTPTCMRKNAKYRTRHINVTSPLLLSERQLRRSSLAVGFSSAGDRPCKSWGEFGGRFTFNFFEAISKLVEKQTDSGSPRVLRPRDVHAHTRTLSFKQDQSEDAFGGRFDDMFSPKLFFTSKTSEASIDLHKYFKAAASLEDPAKKPMWFVDVPDQAQSQAGCSLKPTSAAASNAGNDTRKDLPEAIF